MGIAFALLAVGVLGVFARDAHGGSFPLLGSDGAYHFVYYAVLLGATVLVLARAALSEHDRIAWTSMGVGLAMWTLGDLYWLLALRDSAPTSSLTVSDVLYIGSYPFLYGSVIAMARAQLPHLEPRQWMDGLIAAIALAAVSASIVLQAVLTSPAANRLNEAVSVAYPVADLILLGVITGILAAARFRAARAWLWIGSGLVMFAVADSAHVVQVAHGTAIDHGVVDSGWLVAALLLAVAAWTPEDAEAEQRTTEPRESIAIPIVLGLVPIALMVWDHFKPTNAVAMALAVAASLAVLARLALTFLESQRHLTTSRAAALTDGLTGLYNRRRLIADLDETIRSQRPEILILYDLNGFKTYNDTYGHLAGDALLSRLGAALQEHSAADGGHAYRMGGDEFCVLVPEREEETPGQIMERTAAALVEHGDGFSITATGGWARIPSEAREPSEVLRLADERMYVAKNSGRLSAQSQATGVLLGALNECDSSLRTHLDVVADLAAPVAERLGLDEASVESVRIAAALHDVGKVAIPDAILKKKGPLTEEEWQFMRRHPEMGERIVGAAPVLGTIGKLIRSSHECWDGSGYPDGLKGDEIPLGSQIIFVCDAFDAMTTGRRYSDPRALDEAYNELRRCAGKQFSPAVVDAFIAVYAIRDRFGAGLAAGPGARAGASSLHPTA